MTRTKGRSRSVALFLSPSTKFKPSFPVWQSSSSANELFEQTDTVSLLESSISDVRNYHFWVIIRIPVLCHLIKRISQSEKSIHLWCLTLFRKNHISRWSHLRFLESRPHNSRQTKLRIELRAKIAKFRNATIEKDSFDLGQELSRDGASGRSWT